jgi:SAM-dependent methyltransferase
MIGRHLWKLHAQPRREVYRRFGIPDLDTRQKWAAVWPVLRAADRADGVTLLDAGCGPGGWSLELAARFPHWRITGVDIDADAIERARRDAARLGLDNVAFEVADLFAFQPAEPVEVVLSIFSAHYGVEEERGPQLFDRMASWLRPGGSLVCFLPRPAAEAPFVTWLATPAWHDVLSEQETRDLLAGAGLRLQHLSGRIGRAGAVAKQLARAFGRGWRRVLWPVLYPLGWAMSAVDRPHRPVTASASVFWLAVAERP